MGGTIERIIAVLFVGAAWLASGLPVPGPSMAQCQTDLSIRLPGVNQLPTVLSGGTNPFYLEEAFGFSAGDMERPVGIVRDPVHDKRLYIVGQRGVIYMIRNLDEPVLDVFMDIRSFVDSSSNEEGLLGLAFHPSFASNKYFYVFMTAASTQGCGRDDVVARYTANAALDQGVTSSRWELIRQCDQAWNHNGGPMLFGPEGYLYIGLGDEGGGNDTYNNAQRLDKDFFCGLLRIDVDNRPGNLTPTPHPAIVTSGGAARYAVPADNPYVGWTSLNGQALNQNALRTEFYAIGLRNPWQFSFDSLTGELYCADVGQNAREEINIITAGGNYGWAVQEGTQSGPDSPPNGFQSVEPILEYPHNNTSFGGYSVTGGQVYRGSRFSDLQGQYIFADYVSGRTWAFQKNGQSVQDWRLLATENGTAAIGVDPRNGDLLFADRDDGVIRRLERAPAGNLPPTLDDTGLFCDTANLTPAEGVYPYEVNVPFWSDGATKRRWLSLPDPATSATPSLHDAWTVPTGAVFVKHFEIETEQGNPASTQRLETRVLAKTDTGLFGMTYRWDSADNASLVGDAGFDETLSITDLDGNTTALNWRYPSRTECLQCHTPEAGLLLGVHTAQLNRGSPAGAPQANQLDWLATLGLVDNSLGSPASLPALALLEDTEISAAERFRSWLHVNCAMCHRPGGKGVGEFDSRYQVPIDQAGLFGQTLVNNLGNPNARVIAPCDEQDSMLLTRITNQGGLRMPPLGSNVVDPVGTALLQEWIRGFCTIALDPVQVTAQEDHMLSWSTQPGGTYIVEQSPSMLNPMWTAVTTVSASATTTSVQLVPGTSVTRVFYRVLLVQ